MLYNQNVHVRADRQRRRPGCLGEEKCYALMNPPIMINDHSTLVSTPCRFLAFSAAAASVVIVVVVVGSCFVGRISPYLVPPFAFAGAGGVGRGFDSLAITCGGAGFNGGADGAVVVVVVGAATTGTGGLGVEAAGGDVAAGACFGRAGPPAEPFDVGWGPGVIVPLVGPASSLSSTLACVAGLLDADAESVGVSDGPAPLPLSLRAAFSCARFSARACALARFIALLVGGACGSLHE